MSNSIPVIRQDGEGERDQVRAAAAHVRDDVPHDRRVVLAVDHRDRSHGARTSSSIRSVYFSYSRVTVENWMIFSCP